MNSEKAQSPENQTFIDFFRSVTEGRTPYAWQCRLTCGEPPEGANGDLENPDEATKKWLSRTHPDGCRSRLIDIPTGLGKTAGVVLAWLWNFLGCAQKESAASPPGWPRRLVYCLPMRTLVEQTEAEIAKWLRNLWDNRNGLQFSETAIGHLKWLIGDGTEDNAPHSPIVLMGGEDLSPAKRDWDLYPEKPAILIGTQDMLLSRALNRGYGMSRYRWPMHFALLNNDCLWVMDEVQLMGPGLATACQLDAFRGSRESKPPGFGSFGTSSSMTWYMSATSNREHLNTREWRGSNRPSDFEFSLSSEEKEASNGPIHRRRFALKQLKLKRDLSVEDSSAAEKLIEAILKHHEEMVAATTGDPNLPARTLIICNTVDRAIAVHNLLDAAIHDGYNLVLLHSHFRPPEREAQKERIKPENLRRFPNGQIVVSTQVIEAGVDVSSAVLWSEVAPLASLVQRFGRLNRAGELNSSKWKPTAFVFGVGFQAPPPRESKDARAKRDRDNTRRCLPYDLNACEAAWESLQELNGDASAASLEAIRGNIGASIPRCPYSLQQHELIDFFDTDANLSLGFTDVSPFVRGVDVDTDLHVLWRESWPEKNGKPDFTLDFQRDELCSVSIGKAHAALGILNQGWLWRGKESGWLSVRSAGLIPGMTVLLPLTAGGYSQDAGWTGNPDDNNHCSHYQPQAEPPDEDLLSCLDNGWRSIAAHTAEVAEELEKFINELLPGDEFKSERNALYSAVPWHDIGKSHSRWRWAALRALFKAGVPKDNIRPHLPLAKFSLSESLFFFKEDRSIRLSGPDLKREINRLRRSFRPGIAHEVASGLAFRQAEQQRLGPARDIELLSLLAEYVIMSHHGRVRKVLRDEIPKFPKNEKDTDTVRGVSEGNVLPAITVNSKSLGCPSLATECRQMGRDANGHESYTRGVLRLLERYGLFQLAYFEALFRAADMRASARASQQQLAQTLP